MLPSDELYAQDLQRRRAEREANSVEIKEPSLPQSFSVIFRKLRSLRILYMQGPRKEHVHLEQCTHTLSHRRISNLLPSIIDGNIFGRKDETHLVKVNT